MIDLWLSKDPIGISGGLNQYVAFENNPVIFRDPLGLCSEDSDGFWSTFGSEWSRASYGISLSMGTSLADAANWVGSKFGGQRLDFSGSYGDAQAQLSLRNPGESSDEAYRRIYAEMYGNSKWAIDVANNLDTAGFVAGSLSQVAYEARVINATLTADTWILGNIAVDKIGGDSATALANMAARRQAVKSATARSLGAGARTAIHAYVAQQTYDAIARLNAWSRSR